MRTDRSHQGSPKTYDRLVAQISLDRPVHLVVGVPDERDVPGGMRMVDELAREAAAAARLVKVMARHQGHDAVVLRAAVEIVEAGIPAFPCKARGKTPLTRHGFHNASSVPMQLERWFRRWPSANVAIATGGKGVDVLDVDARPGGSGFPALERLRRAGLTDGWACVVRTPSSGLHFYYPARADVPQRSWSAGDAHIDFRGAGGYVLVPPSTVRRPGGQERRYELIAVGRDPRPLDAEAIKSFLHPPRPMPQDSGHSIQRLPDGRQRIAAWMASRPEGSRNASLFWAACRFVDQHVPELEAQAVLLESTRTSGLEDAEALATIRSAYRRSGSAGPVPRRAEGVRR